MGVGWAAEFLFFLLGTVGNSPPFPCRLPVRQAQSPFPRSVELVPSSDSFIHCVLRVPFHDLYTRNCRTVPGARVGLMDVHSLPL